MLITLHFPLTSTKQTISTTDLCISISPISSLISSILKSLLLTAILFLGPLVQMTIFEEHQLFSHLSSLWKKNPINFLAVLVFVCVLFHPHSCPLFLESCMWRSRIPWLHPWSLQSHSRYSICSFYSIWWNADFHQYVMLSCSLFSGFVFSLSSSYSVLSAHSHHLLEKDENKHAVSLYFPSSSRPFSVNTSPVAQMIVTSIFGFLSTFLTLRTGYVWGAVFSHVFCNTLGPPPIGRISFLDKKQRLTPLHRRCRIWSSLFSLHSCTHILLSPFFSYSHRKSLLDVLCHRPLLVLFVGRSDYV